MDNVINLKVKAKVHPKGFRLRLFLAALCFSLGEKIAKTKIEITSEYDNGTKV